MTNRTRKTPDKRVRERVPAPRAPTTRDDESALLTQSARRCALCFGLTGSLKRRDGQIAHVDRNRGNSKVTNLAWLCLKHHDEYDSRPSQSKGFTPGELRSYRQMLYTAIESGLHLKKDADVVNAKIDAAVIDHERAAFRAGEAILSERILAGIIAHLASEHAYDGEHWDALMGFRDHFEGESHRFVLDEIRQPLLAVHAAITELLRFLAENFFNYPMNQREGQHGTRYRMHPRLNIDRGGAWTPESSREYDEHVGALEKLLERSASAFVEYRRTVKQTLLV